MNDNTTSKPVYPKPNSSELKALKHGSLTDPSIREQVLTGYLLKSPHPGVADPWPDIEKIRSSGMEGSYLHVQGPIFDYVYQTCKRMGKGPTPEEMELINRGDGADVNEAMNLKHYLTGCKAAQEMRNIRVEFLLDMIIKLRPAPRMYGLERFPIWVFPPEIRPFIESVADNAQVDEAMSGVPALGILSGLVANSGYRSVCRGNPEPPNLYCLAVAAPSEHKSTVLKPLVYQINQIERDLLETWKLERRDIQARIAELSSQRDKEKRAGNHVRVGDLTKELLALGERARAYPALTVDDCTPEALVKVLEHNRCPMYVSAEPQLISLICSPYSGGEQNPGRILILRCWGGDKHKKDRKGEDEPGVLQEPLLSISLLIQPEALRMLAKVEGSRETGVLSRFEVAYPRSRVGSRGPGGELKGEDGWNSLVKRLHRGKGRTLHLSTEAWTMLENWRSTLEREIGKGGRYVSIADWIGKLQRGQIMKMATVLHAVWEIPGDEISGPCMRRAIDLGEFFLSHSERVFETFEGEDELRKVAAMIIAAVDKPSIRDDFYKSKVTGSYNQKLKKEPLFADAWRMLEAAGVIVQADQDGKKFKLTDKRLPVSQSSLPSGIGPKQPRTDDDMLAFREVSPVFATANENSNPSTDKGMDVDRERVSLITTTTPSSLPSSPMAKDSTPPRNNENNENNENQPLSETPSDAEPEEPI